MVQAYNFIAAWQLFPEKRNYEYGEWLKSCIYKIEAHESKKELVIFHNWVSLENQALSAQYPVIADGNNMLSLVSPNEWGNNGTLKKFVSGVKLLADHTWMEV